MEELSSEYYIKNRLLKAEELQKQVIKIKRKIFSNNYLDTISSISGLAFIFYKQRQKEKTQRLNIKIVKTKINIQNLVHLDTLISMARLLATSY